MSSNKKYTLSEVQSIIKVASKLENQAKFNEEDTFSMENILEIATSSGISSEKIEAAVHFLESEEIKLPNSNSKSFITFERLVEHQITPEVWDFLVQKSRNYFEDLGQTNHFGNTFEWVGKLKKKAIAHVSITSTKNVSRLKVNVDYSKSFSMIKVSTSLIGFVSFAIFSSLLNLDSISNNIPLVINLIGAAIGYCSSSTILKYYLKKKTKDYTLFIEQSLKLISSKSEHRISLNEDPFTEEEIVNLTNKEQKRAQV